MSEQNPDRPAISAEADQAEITATNIWEAVNRALVAREDVKKPCFGEGMRNKIAGGLRVIFAAQRAVDRAEIERLTNEIDEMRRLYTAELAPFLQRCSGAGVDEHPAVTLAEGSLAVIESQRETIARLEGELAEVNRRVVDLEAVSSEHIRALMPLKTAMLQKENTTLRATIERLQSQITTLLEDPDYEGGVQFWIQKHSQLAIQSLAAINEQSGTIARLERELEEARTALTFKANEIIGSKAFVNLHRDTVKDRDTLHEQLAAVTKERDGWKEAYENAKP